MFSDEKSEREQHYRKRLDWFIPNDLKFTLKSARICWTGLEFYAFNGEVLTARISSSWSGFCADARFRAIRKTIISIVLYNNFPVARLLVRTTRQTILRVSS